MARIRSIKPEFWQDSRIKSLPAIVRLVYLCTWSMADDEGRFEADAHEIWRWGRFVEDSREIASALECLRGLGRLKLYEVDGNPYVQVVHFVKHQKIDHPTKSKCPKPSEGTDLFSALPAEEIRESSASARRTLARDRGSRIVDQGSGSGIVDQGSGILNPAGGLAPPAKKGLNGHDAAPTWLAYSEAYARRYGVAPVRNKSVNSCISSFVKRIGVEESPQVAEFYLSHSRGLYVSSKHAVNLLLRDAEGLRTEWATGKRVTDTEARQQDQTQARGEVFGSLVADAEAREGRRKP